VCNTKQKNLVSAKKQGFDYHFHKTRLQPLCVLLISIFQNYEKMSLLSFSFQGINQSVAKFQGKTRQFELTIDEPIELGGTDKYPNPVEYILAGYAGCLNVVAHIVAKELNIELKKLEINVSGELNPAKLFGQNTTERAGFQRISVNLKPQTTATDIELLGWLQEIERRCPVGDNLQNQTPISLQIEKQIFVASLN
jgi:uncharacterized OsmC-like protein